MKYIVIALLAATLSLSAQEIIVVSSEGDIQELDVSLSSSFGDVLDQVALATGSYSLDFIVPEYFKRKTKKPEQVKRDYTKSLSGQDQKDIAYIIKTLAWAPLPKLVSNKSSLQKAGDRIRPVHPLRFLEFILTNEELKAGLHAIRGRTTFVWGEFWPDLKNSFDDESKIGNLNLNQIADFSSKVGISPDIVSGPVNSKDWQGFFDTLLKHIPRPENIDRYNI